MCRGISFRFGQPPEFRRIHREFNRYVPRDDSRLRPAEKRQLQVAVRRVGAFGPIQRADVALPGVSEETLIEIDAPRDLALKPGDAVGLKPRRCRIFPAAG